MRAVLCGVGDGIDFNLRFGAGKFLDQTRSGDWQDQTAWSLGTRPAPGQTIMLTTRAGKQ